MNEPRNLSGAPTNPRAPETIRSAIHELAAGQIVAGRYEIRARLGEGGMGTVYRAHDRELDEEIALKILLSDWLGDPTMLARFRREVKIARKITHPSVCRVYDYGEADELRFLTMELISGRTLRAALSAGPLDADRALTILKQIAEGLAAAHAQQVIHRDLKPENVILREDGRAVVVDFGLARGPMVENSTVMTIAGTPTYMSPEQLRGEPLGVSSDVFSLGILAFELLTGRSPFDHGSSAATVSAILRDPPRALEVPSLPCTTVAALDIMLARALAKSPSERFSSAAELLTHLALARDNKGILPEGEEDRVGPISDPRTKFALHSSPPASPPSPRPFRKGAWIAAAVAMLSAGVPVWWVGSSSAWWANSSAPAAAPSGAPTSAVAASAPLPEGGRPSLIVAPFENLTADPAWDGLTRSAAETVRGGLRTMPDLLVIEAPRAGDVSEEASRQGAAWIVTGSIERVGPSLRLTAQFRAPRGAVAGERIEIDGDPTNPGALLELLRRDALDEARLLWQDHGRRRRAIEGTKSEAARGKLLEYYAMIGPVARPEHFKVGMTLLDEAIAADPAYASARVERSYLQLRGAGAEAAPERLSAAVSDVDQALAADPSSPPARVMRCRALQLQIEADGEPSDEEIASASDACGAALRADPSSPHVRIVLARLNDRRCEDERAMEFLEQAFELDRSLAGRSLKHIVELSLQIGRLQVADTMSQRLVELEDEERRRGARSLSHRAGVPPTSGARLLRAAVLARLGRSKEAQAELELELTRVSSGTNQLDEMTALRGLLRIAADTKTAPPPGAKQRLGELERQRRAALVKHPAAGLDVAAAYLWIDPDAAVAWLDWTEKPGAPASCQDALRRALFYRGAGRSAEARRSIDACAPRHQWERSCSATWRARLAR